MDKAHERDTQTRKDLRPELPRDSYGGPIEYTLQITDMGPVENTVFDVERVDRKTGRTSNGTIRERFGYGSTDPAKWKHYITINTHQDSPNAVLIDQFKVEQLSE
eukprot:UN03824